MTQPLLQVEDYSVAFRTPRGLARVVDEVSFTLERGKTLGIVGESGSGKSVLNRSIMGLISSDRQIEDGSALFDGHQLVGQDRQPYWGKRIGMIFQDPMTSLNPVMKIGRQIFEPLKLHRNMTGQIAKDRAIELLSKVGIPEPERRLNDYPHQLSGGQRQRVMIAIALAGEPELLIADEPTTALDVTVQKQILDLLADLQADTGMSISDIDLFEVNEAFASVVLRFMQRFDVDDSLVNVNGGSIAMGHPLGATGAIIIGTLLDELERTGKGTGLATLCIASGMGAATIIERV